MPDELEEEIESALVCDLGILAAAADADSEKSSFFLLPKSDMTNFLFLNISFFQIYVHDVYCGKHKLIDHNGTCS